MTSACLCLWENCQPLEAGGEAIINQFIFHKNKGVPIGTPIFLLAAAAAIVVFAVAAVVAAVAAVAEQQDQDDDPPPVVAAETIADVVIITAHKKTSRFGYELCCSFHGIPWE